MIITRRPCRIYDVDLIGCGALALLLVAGYWFAARPWLAMWSQYKSVAQARHSAEILLENDLHTLEALEADLARLRSVIVSEVDEVPAVDAQPQLLREITDLAKACNLEVISVVPRAPEVHGVYLIADIDVGGRGASRDFVRFLDRLAATNPYQSLNACLMSHANHNETATCDLFCTVRLYLLPQRATTGGSTG